MKNGTGFLEALSKKVLVADGGMGTMLYNMGVFINQCFEVLNLERPELVMEVHRGFAAAGAEIIETNTYGANWFKLQKYGYEGKVAEINRRGVELAIEATGGKCYIAGAIGPLRKTIRPVGSIHPRQAFDAFVRQAEALEEGIDLFILETFANIEEIIVAINAVRHISSKPIIASMTITDEVKTIYGATPETIASRLSETAADVIGLNCSVGPISILEAIARMSKITKLPLSAMPNAGLPKNIGGHMMYLATPEYMAEYAKRLIQSGARIVGGCCGTTDAHIRAISRAVLALSPGRIDITVFDTSREETSDSLIPPVPTAEKSMVARKLAGGKFVTCVELAPPRGADPAGVVRKAKKLEEAGVDAINIPDGPRATARMSPMALAAVLKLKENLSLEPILHYCCRDRNILGMQSDLLGADALGLKNILVITGDPPKLGDYPDATAVFDVDSIGLVNIARKLNSGFDLAGNKLGKPTSLHIGVGANPGAINFEEELERLDRKIEGGAEYILTQPVFDLELFLRFKERTSHLKVPILAGILPLESYRSAEFLHNEVPGMSIPPPIREKLKKAQSSDEAREIGISIAIEALEALVPLTNGVYIMTPSGNMKSVFPVLEAIKSFLSIRGSQNQQSSQ